MGVFTGTQEAEHFLGAIWERMAADPKLGPKLMASNLVMRLAYSNPPATITVSCTSDGVALERGDTQTEPQLTLGMTADMGNRFWLGEVKNLPKALGREITIEGKLPNVMKLMPILLPAFKLYRTILEESGRADLVAQ